MTLYEIIDEVKADGIAIGEERGRAEGLEAGALQTRIETARNMIFDDLSFETISKYTGLSIEQLNAIADEIGAGN